MANLNLTISGTARYPVPGSFSVSGRLGSRTVCSFTLIDCPPGAISIEVGTEVIATDASANRIFAGTIDSISETHDLTDSVRTISVNCVDYSQIADRHLVAYAYTSDIDDGTGLSVFTAVAADNGTDGSKGINAEAIFSAIDMSAYTEPSPSLPDHYSTSYLRIQLKCDHPELLLNGASQSYIEIGDGIAGNCYRYEDLFGNFEISTDWQTFDIPFIDMIPYIYVPTWTAITDITWHQNFTTTGALVTISMRNAYIVTKWTAGDIIQDVVYRFWRDGSILESVDTSNVADGPEIEKAVFNYLPSSRVFDELTELTGYVWYIDYNKNLYFIDSTMNAAPFGLTTTGGQWRDLAISSNREMYRNIQYIRAGVAETEERTDTVTTTSADQMLMEFPFPVGTASAITEGGTPKTLGVKGISEGKDYYWTYNSAFVEAAVAPGNGVEIALTYNGLFPILLNERDEAEVLARRMVEGGTGAYSAIYDDPQINVRGMAVAKALALLRRYGEIPQVVTFQTDGAGLRPGQLLSINIPGYDLSGNYLIESVNINDYGGVMNRYDISAVSGEPLGDWLDWFNRLSRQGQKFLLYDEDIVNILEYLSEGLTFADSATESHGQPESRADHAHADFSETDWI